MTILCGTDFSSSARVAERAAAALAARLGRPLVIAHVLDLPWIRITGELSSQDGDRPSSSVAAEAACRDALAQSAAAVQDLGARTETVLLEGAPDEALPALAAERGAQTIVVGSVGRRMSRIWRLGSVADRLAQGAGVPVLVVRDSAPFEAWRRGERALRVTLGVDFTLTSEAAQDWVLGLRAAAPCDVERAHVYAPELEAQRVGVGADSIGAQARSELERSLTADLDARFGATLPGHGAWSSRLLRLQHSEADELVRAAEESRADLLVVGTHARHGWTRLWHGSVSYRVLPLHEGNVACVPAPASGAASRVTSVLAATDFSPLGDRAVAQAAALLPEGGRLRLLHVIETPELPNPMYAHYSSTSASSPEQREAARGEARRLLQQLVPAQFSAAGIEVDFAVVEAADVTRAIVEETDRSGADLLCIGARGRRAAAGDRTGLTMQALLADSPVPVVVVGSKRAT